MAKKLFGFVGVDGIIHTNRKNNDNGFAGRDGTGRIQRIESAISWEPKTGVRIAADAGAAKETSVSGHLIDEINNGRMVKVSGGYRWHYLVRLDGVDSPELAEGGPELAEAIFCRKYGLTALPATQPAANTATNTATITELQKLAAEASARLSAAMSGHKPPKPPKQTEKTVSVGTAIVTLAERLLSVKAQERLLELVEEAPTCSAQDSGYTPSELRGMTQFLADEVLRDMAAEIHATDQVSSMLDTMAIVS